jgi:hypothetical protein
MSLIALNSPGLLGIKSRTMATKAPPPQHLSQPNSSLTPRLTPKAKFYGMDLSNFYLTTPMKEYEYMQLRLELIPNEIIHQYNFRDLVNEQGWVYIKI